MILDDGGDLTAMMHESELLLVYHHTSPLC